MVEGDRPKTVGIEKIRARSRILVDRDDQRAAIARQVRALDIPLGLEHGHAFAGRQIAPDEESELAAVVGGVVELRPFVGKGLRSEEHTSELQSLMRISYAVFCLKKTNTTRQHPDRTSTNNTHEPKH